MDAVASPAITSCTGLLEDWERKEKRKENHNNTGGFMPLPLTVRSLSHLASLHVGSFAWNSFFLWEYPLMGFRWHCNQVWRYRGRGKVSSLVIYAPCHPNLPVTIYFSEFSNSCTCILSMFYYVFSGRMCLFHLARQQNPNKLFAVM